MPLLTVHGPLLLGWRPLLDFSGHCSEVEGHCYLLVGWRPSLLSGERRFAWNGLGRNAEAMGLPSS